MMRKHVVGRRKKQSKNDGFVVEDTIITDKPISGKRHDLSFACCFD